MYPTVHPPASVNLGESPSLEVSHLEQIQARLDFLLLALEALAKIEPTQILQTIQALNLAAVISDRSFLWRSNHPSFTVPEAQAWTVTLSSLARQHQELIRRAVSLLEQMQPQDEPPQRLALLADYLENFTNLAHTRLENYDPRQLTTLAWKLLVDLLFYSSPQGDRRLWSVLTTLNIPNRLG
jgi:hypothetical protein